MSSTRLFPSRQHRHFCGPRVLQRGSNSGSHSLAWNSLLQLVAHRRADSLALYGHHICARPFATKTPRNSKKSRKAQSLAAPRKSPKTTRERIRWLKDHNQVLHDNHYRHKAIDRRIEDVGEATEERLNWMRNKIYGFWRGGEEAETSQTSARPPRVGPKMDAKWWFWNIMLALLPAFSIAAYCEFIGKPKMMEFHRQMRIREQRKNLGDAYNEEEDEALARITQQSKPLTERLYDAVRDLMLYFLGQGVPPHVEPAVPTTSDDEPKQGTQKTQSSDVKRPTSTNDQSPTTSTSNKSTDDDDDAETIAALKLRLEALERRLHERQTLQQAADKPESTPLPESASTNTSSSSSSSSRIHNRVLEQRREESRLREHDAAARKNEESSSALSLWKTLGEKTTALKEYWTGSSAEQLEDAPQQQGDKHKAKEDGCPKQKTSSASGAPSSAGISGEPNKKDNDANTESSQQSLHGEPPSSNEGNTQSKLENLKSKLVGWWKTLRPSKERSEDGHDKDSDASK